MTNPSTGDFELISRLRVPLLQGCVEWLFVQQPDA